MNHIYRVVFNRSLGVYQCVSELAKSCGKSSGKSQVATKLIVAPLAVAMIGLSGTAMAVTYDDGQTTTISDDVYFVEKDIVSNIGTELVVNKLILEKISMKREIKTTSDGSKTLYINDLNESYHSQHGALQEAQHVFIDNGLILLDNYDIHILELGLE